MNGTLYDKSTLRNYFPLPNSIFSLGLKPGEFAVYSYLMYCENRKSFTCYPSYETIGEHTGMSKNTVAKYVQMLVDKGLIKTEPTLIPGPDGEPRNGTLLYTILPPGHALNLFYDRQIEQAKLQSARQKAEKKLTALNRESCHKGSRSNDVPGS